MSHILIPFSPFALSLLSVVQLTHTLCLSTCRTFRGDNASKLQDIDLRSNPEAGEWQLVLLCPTLDHAGTYACIAHPINDTEVLYRKEAVIQVYGERAEHIFLSFNFCFFYFFTTHSLKHALDSVLFDTSHSLYTKFAFSLTLLFVWQFLCCCSSFENVKLFAF